MTIIQNQSSLRLAGALKKTAFYQIEESVKIIKKKKKEHNLLC